MLILKLDLAFSKVIRNVSHDQFLNQYSIFRRQCFYLIHTKTVIRSNSICILNKTTYYLFPSLNEQNVDSERLTISFNTCIIKKMTRHMEIGRVCRNRLQWMLAGNGLEKIVSHPVGSSTFETVLMKKANANYTWFFKNKHFLTNFMVVLKTVYNSLSLVFPPFQMWLSANAFFLYHFQYVKSVVL